MTSYDIEASWPVHHIVPVHGTSTQMLALLSNLMSTWYISSTIVINCGCVYMQMDEEGAEKIGTVQEAADMITQQIDNRP